MKFVNVLFSFLILFSIFSCSEEENIPIQNLIPIPDQIELGSKWSSIKSLSIGDNDLGKSLKNALESTSFSAVNFKKDEPNISVDIIDDNFNEIKIEKNQIDLKLSNEDAVFWASTILNQLYIFNNNRWPICTIKTKEKFGYRGMHLDVSRHFFSVNDIKRYIDFLHFYGYNIFHWHLTDDQGWRMEIKQYPKLQSIAAFRDETLIGHYNDQPQKFDQNRYGGYYTQDEVLDVIRYAQLKGIEIVPEIEMPGHASAAIAAYPYLGCENKKYSTATKWGVFNDIFCPTDTTFAFIENVLEEVMSVFPSSYIHIGGDEVPKEAWRKSAYCQKLISEKGLENEAGLQSYFIKRIETFVNSKGKSIIGWDEILDGGLAPNATVMSWRGAQYGIEAAKQGHKVIMSPTSHCYFDYYQSNHSNEPVAIGGFIPLEKVYSFDPIPRELSEEQRKLILGAQANVWTEYMPNFYNVEYMALSRMLALSEVLWRSKENADFNAFKLRHDQHKLFWQSKGVNFADYGLDVDVKVFTELGKGSYFDKGKLPEGSVLEIKEPGSTWTTDNKDPFFLKKDGLYEVRALKEGKFGRHVKFDFINHKGSKAGLLLVHPASQSYPGLGGASLNNGIKGPSNKYGGNEWLGFSGNDLDVEYVFENRVKLEEIKMRFFNGEGQWIYLPKSVEVHVSNDGKIFKKIYVTNNISSKNNLAEIKIPMVGIQTQYLKIVAHNHGRIAQGNPGEGHQAWLFVDEIIIK